METEKKAIQCGLARCLASGAISIEEIPAAARFGGGKVPGGVPRTPSSIALYG